MDDLTAGGVRSRTFKVTLRGYDQGEVEGYLEQVAEYLEVVQQQLAVAGLTDVAAPGDLADRYAAIGDEVAGVLHEARKAADAMRSRAAADVEEWRRDAKEETQQARAETAAAIRQVRESVWETGTEMLEQVVAECESLWTEAREASLRLRSESERESTRMMTDAQREREELLRAGREEADRTVSSARKDADALLMAARHQTDVAHERTRVLEERRTELVEELESMQKALLGIEDKPGRPQPNEEPAGNTEPTRSHWPEGEGAVRIVAARSSVQTEPVDADALVAEVEALRGSPRTVSPSVGGRTREAASAEPAPSAAAAPALRSDEDEVRAEDRSRTRLPSKAEETAQPDPQAEPEREPEPEPDPLAGLFDELRTPAAPPQAVEPHNGSINDEVAQVEAAVAVLRRDEDREPEAEDSGLKTQDVSPDPFALRDRLLLPVQNRALRLVKRELVSAQNRALEELRLDPEWTPENGLIDGEVSGMLSDLTDESTAAGFAAAAELLGRTDAPQPDLEIDDPSSEFTDAFVDAVSVSLERSRSGGAGKRETSSALSRVFRAWRTDDAERRVQLLSRRAYHAGVLAALPAMDCDRVVVIPSGRSCVDHGGAALPWLIAEGPPPGTLIPPASLECSCAVVPDC